MEAWSGLAMLVVAVGVALPVLIAGVPVLIPRPLWILALIACWGGIVLAGVLSTRRSAALASLALAVVSSWVVIVAVAGSGLLHVLVVITAATSVYLVSVPVTLGLIGANTLVLLLTNLSTLPGTAEPLMITGFYLLIQLASALSTSALARERRMRQDLAAAHVQLRAAGMMLGDSARTAERLRISRELHDLIGHQLTVLTLVLEAAKHSEPPQAEEQIRRADEVARGLLRDVRTTVGELREDSRDLDAALQELVGDLPGLDVETAVPPGLRLDPERATAILRLVQEATTNTLRHAEASRLRIHVAQEGGTLRATVSDDGIGAPRLRPGNGLRGLQERFDALGGSVGISGGSADRGVTVTGELGER